MANKYVIASVFDRAVGLFTRPSFFLSRQHAVRSFADSVSRDAEDNPLFHHPEDMAFYILGEWSEETGLFELLSQPQLLMRGVDVKERAAASQEPVA